jgi:hypothetical protein
MKDVDERTIVNALLEYDLIRFRGGCVVSLVFGLLIVIHTVGNMMAPVRTKPVRPKVVLTMPQLIEECMSHLSVEDTDEKVFDKNVILNACSPDRYLHYSLVDAAGNVIRENDPTTIKDLPRDDILKRLQDSRDFYNEPINY